MIDEKKLLNEMIDLLAKDCKNMELAGKIVGLIDTQPTIQPQGIDKDRLIRDLNLNTNYGFYGEFTDGSEIAFTLRELMAIINQQPTSDGWIPVSEEKPKRVNPVLVTVHPPTFPEPYTSMDYITSYGNWKSYNDEYITAWQPLPQPYKESE